MEKAARDADHSTFGRMGQKDGPDQRQQEKKRSSPKKSYVYNVAPVSPKERVTCKCAGCGNSNHTLERCESFTGKPVKERRKEAVKKGLCFNCLETGHRAQECQSDKICKEKNCGRKHHRLLHDSSPPWKQEERNPKDSDSDPSDQDSDSNSDSE